MFPGKTRCKLHPPVCATGVTSLSERTVNCLKHRECVDIRSACVHCAANKTADVASSLHGPVRNKANPHTEREQEQEQDPEQDPEQEPNKQEQKKTKKKKKKKKKTKKKRACPATQTTNRLNHASRRTPVSSRPYAHTIGVYLRQVRGDARVDGDSIC
jgi:Mg-chelatase subunit ChlI